MCYKAGAKIRQKLRIKNYKLKIYRKNAVFVRFCCSFKGKMLHLYSEIVAIMRKIPFVLAVASALVLGCQTNDTNNSAVGVGEGATLSISLPQTRISLGGKVGNVYPVSWSDGDKIVVNGTLSEEAQIDADNRNCAKFAINPSLVAPLRVTYPYCEATSAERPIVAFPAEQEYVEGTFALGSAPMCGYAEGVDDAIVLSHLAAVLRFPVKALCGGVILEKIVISPEDGSKIAGEFSVDCATTALSATANSSNSITYTLPDNFELSTSEESVFYIALPAVNVGICKVEFVEQSGGSMICHWNSKSVVKGVVREFKTILYKQGMQGVLSPMVAEEDELTLIYKKYAGINELKIMSFNVRTSTTEADAANNWDNRKTACVELLWDHLPDIVGFQEAKYSTQWLYLKEQLAVFYDGYGVNRDTGAESGSGEVMGILYNNSRIEKIDGGTFWLSETPDVPSKGFGANHSRSATWGLFKHKSTDRIFYYINTHLDHQVKDAQIEGMKLISKRFEEYKDTCPVFLTGDLNIASNNVAIDPIEVYMHNTRDAAQVGLTDYNTTYNGFTTGKQSIIDHIYCSDYLRVAEYHTINEQYGDVNFVSDHYPVYSIIKLK